MSPADPIRIEVELALRPGLSPAEYDAALGHIAGRHRITPGLWREILEAGVPSDPRARRALFVHLAARGVDLLPMLVYDTDHAAQDLCAAVLQGRARSVRERADQGIGSPTGLPCMRCGGCTLESFARHDRGDWTETELRCALCGALHLACEDPRGGAIDLLLLDAPAA